MMACLGIQTMEVAQISEFELQITWYRQEGIQELRL